MSNERKRKMGSTAKPFERQNPARSRNSVLRLLYNPRFPNLKVEHKCGAVLAIMGVPGRCGEHFLWPEEAIYLLEICTASITFQGRYLTLNEGYRILEEKQIGFHRFSAYCYLKKAGFVVLRPREFIDATVASANTSSMSQQTNLKNVKPVLDNLPCVLKGTMEIDLPLQIHSNLMPGINTSIVPHSSVFRFSSDVKRFERCRPRNWPSLEAASSSATSWAEYSSLRKSIISSVREKRKTQRYASTAIPVDFEVFSAQNYSFSLPPAPLFRVVCYDARNDPFNVRILSRLASNTTIPLIVAISVGNNVNFVRTSGSTVDIAQFA